MPRLLPRLPLLFSAFALSFQLFSAAHAECRGESILGDLPPEKLAAIQTATDAVPFPTGNFWRATRGDQVITIAGTYHLDDPRHAANLAALTPSILSAKTVLVEAGPEDTDALQALIAKDPSKIIIQTGPTLTDQLPPEVWTDLSTALANRGIPAFMAAKFKPWYVIAVLSVPPCLMAELKGEPKGLDGMVIDTATGANIPVQGLEPFDTIFRIFDQFSDEEIISMIQSNLALEAFADDQAETLAEGYFAGESRKIWELTRVMSYDMPGYTKAQVDAEFAKMEQILITDRNRAWIPVLIGAAQEGPVFAAFGALHLSGEAGVLNLLKAEGFALEELPL